MVLILLHVDEFYANTSTKVAFHLINPILWASRADVWRQAILYVFGGVYLDFDAYVKNPFDSFVFHNDSFVYSYEMSHEGFVNRYKREHHLGLVEYHRGSIDSIVPTRRKMRGYIPTLVQWLIISKPKCVFIERTLNNIIELLGNEFMGESMLQSTVQGQVRLLMFYTTGPLVFTASIEETLQESMISHSNFSKADIYRRVYPKTNFKEVGAKHFQKRSYSNEVKRHMEENHGYSPRLLSSYYNHGAHTHIP